MRVNTNIHLHGDTRVAAPDQADGFLEVASDSDTLNLFLGYDDATRVENIDKLAEALLEIRIRCLQRMVKFNDLPKLDEPDPIDQAKAAADGR